MNYMKGTIERVDSNNISISPWLKAHISRLKPEKEMPLTKEQWAKLSPAVKQMVKQGKILMINSA